jgi:hypothetical protein
MGFSAIFCYLSLQKLRLRRAVEKEKQDDGVKVGKSDSFVVPVENKSKSVENLWR